MSFDFISILVYFPSLTHHSLLIRVYFPFMFSVRPHFLKTFFLFLFEFWRFLYICMYPTSSSFSYVSVSAPTLSRHFPLFGQNHVSSPRSYFPAMPSLFSILFFCSLFFFLSYRLFMDASLTSLKYYLSFCEVNYDHTTISQ